MHNDKHAKISVPFSLSLSLFLHPHQERAVDAPLQDHKQTTHNAESESGQVLAVPHLPLHAVNAGSVRVPAHGQARGSVEVHLGRSRQGHAAVVEVLLAGATRPDDPRLRGQVLVLGETLPAPGVTKRGPRLG